MKSLNGMSKKRRTWPKIKTVDFFFKKLIGRFTMIKHCDLWTTWSVGINKLSLSTYQVTFILYIWKLIKYRPWPDRLCLWWKNSSLLFSSCHLQLVILENTLFFCLLFVKSTSSRWQEENNRHRRSGPYQFVSAAAKYCCRYV